MADTNSKTAIFLIATGLVASPAFVLQELHKHDLENRGEYASRVEVQDMKTDLTIIKSDIKLVLKEVK